MMGRLYEDSSIPYVIFLSLFSPLYASVSLW